MRPLRIASIRARLLVAMLSASAAAFAVSCAAVAVAGWLGVAEHPHREPQWLLLGLSVGALAGGLAAWRLHSWACRPLAILGDGVAAAARDRDFSRRIEPCGGDETGQLVAALNAMLAEIDQRTTALREKHAQLERHVAERTLELRQEVAERTMAEVFARRAHEAAQAANAAKDEFLSRMSHELRTPLNAILGFAQLLEMDALTEEQAGEVRQILDAGNRLLLLVNDVLDISRLSTGALELAPEPVALGDALLETLALVAPDAAAASVRLPQPEELEGIARRSLHVDRARLGQVFLQLISNAVKYNRPGGEVRITATDSCDRKLRIEITDTGAGIAPEMLARLFTAFDRLDAPERNIAGTGVGLVLARQLTEAMGGTLTAKSQVDVGSTFSIELPLAAEPAMALAEIDAPGAGRAILYAEDGLPHFGAIEQCLAAFPDVELFCAATSWAALEAARVRRPDLILLDLHLPGASGSDLLAHLKNDPATRDTPVALLCSETTPRQIAQLLQAGASHFLSKPLDPVRVSILVEEVLGLEPAAAACP